MTHNVGLIGLGAMGSGMAASLRRAGHRVHVYDVRTEMAQAFARGGGVACESLAQLGAACDGVISVVVNAAQTEAVLFGANIQQSKESSSACAAAMKVKPALQTSLLVNKILSRPSGQEKRLV